MRKSLLAEFSLWVLAMWGPGVVIFVFLVQTDVAHDSAGTYGLLGFYYALVFYAVLLFFFCVIRVHKYVSSLEQLGEGIQATAERLDESVKQLQDVAEEIRRQSSGTDSEELTRLSEEVEHLNARIQTLRDRESP